MLQSPPRDPSRAPRDLDPVEVGPPPASGPSGDTLVRAAAADRTVRMPASVVAEAARALPAPLTPTLAPPAPLMPLWALNVMAALLSACAAVAASELFLYR